MIRHYVAEGMSIDKCLDIVGISKNQYYYKLTGNKPGRKPSTVTSKLNHSNGDIISIPNEQVVKRIVDIKLDPDHSNYYKLITKTLCLEGYYINHKKVYRLMYENIILEPKNRITGKTYVKYRRVAPSRALEVLEMDIKYVWIYEKQRYAFVLTVIDTFTRYVLHWAVGYSMKSEQVQHVWEYIIANNIQPIVGLDKTTEIEIRNDNGRQFSSKAILGLKGKVSSSHAKDKSQAIYEEYKDRLAVHTPDELDKSIVRLKQLKAKDE